MRIGPSTGLSLAATALIWALTSIGSFAQQDSTVSFAKAIQDLQYYREMIERRWQAMDDLYDYDRSTDTLKAAFLARGVSQGVAESAAKSASHAGLSFDYIWASKAVYGYHNQALLDSVAYVQTAGTAREDELAAIAAGMEQWTDYEETLQSLLAERVELFTKAALYTDESSRIEAIACGGNAACEKAKTAAAEAVNAASYKLAFGANREAIAAMNAKFFAAMKGDTNLSCTSMNLSYQPSAIPFQAVSKAIIVYAPPNCHRTQAVKTFTLIGSPDAFSVDKTSGQVRSTRKVAAAATIKVVHEGLTATAEVSSLGPDCNETVVKDEEKRRDELTKSYAGNQLPKEIEDYVALNAGPRVVPTLEEQKATADRLRQTSNELARGIKSYYVNLVDYALSWIRIHKGGLAPERKNLVERIESFNSERQGLSKMVGTARFQCSRLEEQFDTLLKKLDNDIASLGCVDPSQLAKLRQQWDGTLKLLRRHCGMLPELPTAIQVPETLEDFMKPLYDKEMEGLEESHEAMKLLGEALDATEPFNVCSYAVTKIIGFKTGTPAMNLPTALDTFIKYCRK